MKSFSRTLLSEIDIIKFLSWNFFSFQLKPIERYAVNFLEAEYKPEFEEEVKEAKVIVIFLILNHFLFQSEFNELSVALITV